MTPSTHHSALAAVRAEAGHLTPALERLASAVLGHPERVVYQSVTELAEEASVGEASVIRFCRDLGFRGFQDFKLALAADLALRPEGGASKGTETLAELLEATTQEGILALRETSASLSPESLEAAVTALLSAEIVLVYGAGASGVTAKDFAYKLLRLGYPVLAPTDAHLAAMQADGVPLARREKGPLWLMYPISDQADLQDPIYIHRLIWQLEKVEPS